MNFRSWLFTEEVAFLRDLLKTHQVIYLGKMGLWNVYSAVASRQALDRAAQRYVPTGTGRVLTVQEYEDSKKYSPDNMPTQHISYKQYNQRGKLRATGSFLPIVDYFAERLGDVKMHCENAANKLVSIGFPKYTTNMVFMDLSGIKNHITGGGVGGQAFIGSHQEGSKHAFTVERREVSEKTIVHEHAHMWWDNVMNKDAKYAFDRWYQENVSDWITKPVNYAAYVQDDTPLFMQSHRSKLKEAILRGIREQEHQFQEKLENIIGRNLHGYFWLRWAVDKGYEDQIVRYALMRHFRAMAPARLVRDVDFVRRPDGFPRKTIEKGQVIQVEKVNRGYYLNHYASGENRDRWESVDLIEEDQLSNYVRFEQDLLVKKQREEVTVAKRLGKKKISAALAPKDKKDEIIKAFDEVLEYVFKYNVKEDGFKYDYDPRRHSSGNWYNTWVSMIGRRAKAGKIKHPLDVLQTFRDAVKTKLYIPQDIEPSDIQGTARDEAEAMQKKIGGPEGRNLRMAISKKGVTPTSYAASNSKELWAEVVEEAAFNPQGVSRELRKMLYSVLSNIPIGITRRGGRPPRRLKRRKYKKGEGGRWG